MKRLLLSFLALMAIAVCARAEATAYAVWCSSNTTLYFLGSEETLSAGGTFTPDGATDPLTITNVWSGTAVTASSTNNVPGWQNTVRSALTTVVFEPSFHDFTPTSLRGWFNQCSKLTSVQGIGNLNTSATTNMAYMFSGCSILESIDLSSLNTATVTLIDHLFYSCPKLATINLNGFNTSAVTNMNSMFYGCTVLSSLDISTFNTEKVTDMQYMFYGCKGLTSLDLSHFNTATVTSTQQMFNGCNNLESLNLSGWTNTKLTNFSNMFRDCWKLSTLTLTDFQTPAATSFNSMFYNCRAMTGIDLSGFNTEKVSDMQYMFYGCTGLTAIDLSSFNTSALTSTYQMFYGCTGLQSVNLSGWANTKLTNMSYMFYNCSALATLNLTDFNTAAVTNMSYMFSGCKALESLNLSGFNTASVTNMGNMFQNCEKLGSLDLSGFNTAKVTNMSYMFDGCKALATLNMSNWNTALVTNMSYMFQNCAALTSLELSSWNTAKVTNMTSMFSGCTNLQSVYVSLAWTTGLANNSSNMFKGCTSLVGEDGTTLATYNNSSLDRTHGTDEAGGYLKTGTTTELDEPLAYAVWCADNKTLYFLQSTKQLVTGRSFTPSGSESPVKMTTVWSGTQVTTTSSSNPQWLNTVKTTMQHVSFEPSFADVTPNSLYAWFYQCTALQDLTGLANLNTASVTNLGYMFSGATAIQSIDLSSLNTAAVTNMAYMFQNCTSLQSLNLTDFNTEKVTNMAYMFQNCSSLQSLDLTMFNTVKVQSMQYMFNGCTQLQSLDLSSFTMPAISSLDYMFKDCASLTTLNLSSFDIGSRSPSIREMFRGCTQLQSIYVSNLWTLAKRSDADVFNGCSALVGEDGTTLDASAVTAAKAHYASGGYLRKGTMVPDNETPMNYAIYCADNKTIYYTYSKQPLQQGSVFMPEGETTGHVVTLFNQDKNGNVTYGQKWASTTAATTVVFESSYSQLRPTSMYKTFRGLSALTTIRGLEYLNTEDVTNMQETFYGCSSLTSLDLSSFNTKKVQYINDMFRGCSSLRTLDLSSFVTTKVEYIFYMFYGCSSLENIYVGDGWTTAGISANNSNYMFTDCTSLPNFDADVVDKTNAHPYEGGYMSEGTSTPIDPTPYVVWNDESKTLYFLRSTKLLVAGRRFTPTGSETAVNIDVVWDNTYNYVDSNPGWIAYTVTRNGVEHVVIDPSYADVRPTSMYHWFYYCYNLEDISGLQYLNTSEVTTMYQTFYHCNKLTELDLRGWNTEKVTTMYNMFGECGSLETVDLSTFRTPKVTTLQYLFSSCKALKSIDLSGFSNEELTNAGSMFNYCSSLETINMNGFGIGKLTNLGYLFSGAIAVRSLDLHTFNTSNVTNLNSMFSNCEALESVNLSGWNTEKVTTMSWMFNNCKALTAVDLSSFRSPELVDVSYMFDGCASLQSIDLSGLGQTKVTSVYSMFEGCSSVKTVSLAGFGTGEITSTSSLFSGMESLESIDLSSINLSSVILMDYMFDGCKKLKSITLTGQTGEVKGATGMFRGCTALETLDISGMQTSEELRDYDQMFMDCAALKTVDLTPLSGGRPWKLDEMFSGCTSLETLDVSPLYTGFTQSMEEMFMGCASLKSIDFSGMSGYNMNDMDYMFEGCTSLESVNLDMVNLGYAASRKTDPQVFINGLFKDCSSLRSINLRPLRSMTIDSQTKIEIFSGCSSLESLDLSEFYTTRDTDLTGLFSGCSSLTELNLAKFKTENVTDMSEMFKGCTQLQSIYIDAGWNTDNVTVSTDMFTDCNALVGQYGATVATVAAIDATSANAETEGLMRMLSIPYAIYCDANKTLYLTMRDVMYNVGDEFTPAGSDTPLTVTTVQLKDALMDYNYNGLLSGDAAAAETVVIEESFATQYPTNMCNWFKGGSKLTAITGLENLNTDEVTNMYSMFEGCRLLTSLDLSTFNLEQVESMRDMFKDCDYLQSVNLTADPDDTHGYTDQLHDMAGMFSGCNQLQSINFQNFLTVGVFDMSNMFYNCRNLETINLGRNWDTRNVTDMSFMFYNCNSLASIDLSLFSNLNCRNMTGMFANCRSLTQLDMSTFAGYYTASPYTLTNVKYMFYGCNKLKTIYVGDEWVEHYSDYVDGTGFTLFTGCTSIVGGSGTTYDSSNTSSAMANAETGYFTYKGIDVTIPTEGLTTFSAPFNVIVPDGLTAYTAPDYESDESVVILDHLPATTINDAEYTIIPEYTGVLLRGEAGQTVKLIATQKAGIANLSQLQHNQFIPTYEGMHIPTTDGDYTNLLLSGNRFMPVEADGADVADNSAVLQVPTAPFGENGTVWLPWETVKANSDGQGNYWTTYYHGQVSYIADENTTVYVGSVSGDKAVVELTEVEDKNIPAGNAVILKSTQPTVTMTFAEGRPSTADYSGNDLQGSMTATATPDGTYMMTKGNKGVGFYHWTGANIPARRAFITLAAAGARTFLGMSESQGEATGVSNAIADPATEGNSLLYDLQGRKHGAAPSQLAPGVYVRNGKKVVIKK